MDTLEIQEMLIDGLRAFGMPKDGTLGVLLLLQEDDQRWELMEFMATPPHPTLSEIWGKVVEISGGPDEFKIVDGEEAD